MRNKINKLSGTPIIIQRNNIDTDQIIPARFLKNTSREGFGKLLFYDWRFTEIGERKTDSLYDERTMQGEILIAGENFGCGSSREHAAWAVGDAGFKVVISSFFADIFRNNALNNGILPIQVSESFIQKAFEIKQNNLPITVDVDLENQTVTLSNLSETFDITPYKKECLMNGYDDVEYLINQHSTIETFEENRINQ